MEIELSPAGAEALLKVLKFMEIGIISIYTSGEDSTEDVDYYIGLLETYDKIKEDINYIQKVSNEFIMGLLRGLDNIMPEDGSEDEPIWDSYWELFRYLYELIRLRTLSSEN